MRWYNLPRKVIYRGLLALYEQQTDIEQYYGRTIVPNGKGFNAVDAPILSLYARTLKQTGTLSEPALLQVKKRLYKYRQQLINMGLISKQVLADEPIVEQLVLEF